MTLSEIWEQLKRKDPKLKDDDAQVVFLSKNLHALLRQVYEQGQLNPVKKKEESKPPPPPQDPIGAFGDIFGETFGKRNGG